eukprot:gene11205-18824_t
MILTSSSAPKQVAGTGSQFCPRPSIASPCVSAPLRSLGARNVRQPSNVVPPNCTSFALQGGPRSSALWGGKRSRPQLVGRRLNQLRSSNDFQQQGGSSSSSSGSSNTDSSCQEAADSKDGELLPKPSSNSTSTNATDSDGTKSQLESTALAAGDSKAGDSDSDSDAAAAAAKRIAVSEQVVAEALLLAKAALKDVETSLDKIQDLPSAQQETQLQKILKAAIGPAVFAAACTAVVMSHGFGLFVQWGAAFTGGLIIALWGVHKGSLSQSGAVAAMMVGTGTLGCSLRLGATLLAFFFSSSKFTKYKEEQKEIDESAKKGGQRDWLQVACNGLVPTLLAITYGVLVGCVDVPLGPSLSVELWRSELVTALMGAYLGYYACCCGDTWASELGPLSSEQPRLITSMRPVRRGTNGGVTLAGLAASLAGGMFMGLVFYAAALVSPTLWVFPEPRLQWKLIPLGLFAGLFGSVLDSVLGATLQFSGYNPASGLVTSVPGPDIQTIAGVPFLTNNAVNAVSATTTALLIAFMSLRCGMFGF